MFVAVSGILHLYMCRVEQQYAGKVHSGRGAKYGPVKAFGHQTRYQPAMVNMRMRQDHVIQFFGVETKMLVQAFGVIAQSLKHAAV